MPKLAELPGCTVFSDHAAAASDSHEPWRGAPPKRSKCVAECVLNVIADPALAGAPIHNVHELGKFTHFPEILRSSHNARSVIVR